MAAVQIHTADDSPVLPHVIAVPQSPLSWHVLTAETSLGAWVRDHHASVRPLRRQHDQYLQRVVTLTTGALQRELADVQQRTIRLADDLARLTALRDPEALSAAQHVRAHFRGHDQRLQRLTRTELQMFMERVQVFHDTTDRLPLDTMLFESSVAQARRADLNECLERGEEAIKPLIELMSSLIHTVKPGPLPRRIAQEIFNVVGFTSNNAVKLPHFTFALRTYPAQLFIQAVAIATVEAEAEESWTYFRDLLARPVELPSLQGARRGYLPSHLVFRQPLNLVLALASDSSAASYGLRPIPVHPGGHPMHVHLPEPYFLLLPLVGLNPQMSGFQSESVSYPFNRRAAFLTTPGWVGDALPVLHPERRYWSGEALLTLGYWQGHESG